MRPLVATGVDSEQGRVVYYLHNQPWATPEDVELDGEFQWNLWAIRQSPYNQIAVGDHVLLSCPAPEGSRITFEVELTQVEKASYATKREAWRIITSAFPESGLTFRSFREAPYTQHRPDSGYVLAFTYDPLQELQITRPQDWKLRPNGWLVLTDEQASGVVGDRAKHGQGRLLNPAVRRAAELRAMERARQWLLEDRGFSADDVRNTSLRHSYDFEAGPADAPVLRVEVKGLSGGYGPVSVTAGEVRSAQKGGVPTAMVIVSGIRVRRSDRGPVAEGGQLHVVDPWLPTRQQLTAEQYRYEPPR